MSKFKRPCYVVELPTGVKVVGPDGELVEATVGLGIRETFTGAERLQDQHPGSIIRKEFMMKV